MADYLVIDEDFGCSTVFSAQNYFALLNISSKRATVSL
jgi:hypothetical protein